MKITEKALIEFGFVLSENGYEKRNEKQSVAVRIEFSPSLKITCYDTLMGYWNKSTPQPIIHDMKDLRDWCRLYLR